MNGEPIYSQIKRALLEGIASGLYARGAKLPSENDLVARFGCSRMTVNRALRELTQDGVLTRVQGSGTFVSEEKARASFLEVRDIREEIAGRGAIHAAEVLTLEAMKADAETAKALGLRKGGRVFHSRILHRADGVPLQLEDRHVSPGFAPAYLEQDFTDVTPYEYLWTQGPITEVEHIVEAIAPSAKITASLALEEGEGVLLLRRRTWVGEAVVMTGCFYHPGSRFSLAGRFSYAGR